MRDDAKLSGRLTALQIGSAFEHEGDYLARSISAASWLPLPMTILFAFSVLFVEGS